MRGVGGVRPSGRRLTRDLTVRVSAILSDQDADGWITAMMIHVEQTAETKWEIRTGLEQQAIRGQSSGPAQDRP